MCLCESLVPRGHIAPFWGRASLPEKVSRDMGYRSGSIAISRDTGPLSEHCVTATQLNKEVRPFFLSDNSIWSYPSVFPLRLQHLEVLEAIEAL